MANFKKKLTGRLHLNHAYGQLIALIFVPIVILASVGASLVLIETSRAGKAQQSQAASAIFTRYHRTANHLLKIVYDHPERFDEARNIMQYMFNEPHLNRAALIDMHGYNRLSIGYQDQKHWPRFPINTEAFGPIASNSSSNFYGIRVGYTTNGPVWLVIELDNQPLTIAKYRVMIVLITTGLLTLLLLLLFLNFYSRRWIAPMFEIRLQLQRLTADTLDQPIQINSTGELRLLQKDIASLIRRLHFSFLELKEHTEQTEDDLRRTLDTLEVQNITYRKARDQAIQASQSKSVFLANISHELRTPLNSIDGFIHLMLRQGNLSQEHLLYVQTIRKSSAHLLALINDVLDFSKIDAGKLELDSAPFDLEEAVFDVMDMLSPPAASKQINMAIYYASDVPKHVIGDALRFKQVLTNLVSNAIKFTPEGEIIVRVRLEELQANECSIHFSVQDSGIGLSGADRKKLFESFSQGDASVTRQFGGTGLGLAISKQLVHLMQGNIGFEDNQERAPTEKGATFWFSAHFKLNPEIQLQHPAFPELHAITFIAHPATANALRHYLETYQVRQTEANTLLDLFSRLNQLEDANQNVWLIVDQTGDPEALLKEIRGRYTGHIALYGYQMLLDPKLLEQYQAHSLHQPLSRSALMKLFSNENERVDLPMQFNGHGLHVLAVDDHLPNLIVLEALLSELNVKMTKALSGTEALQLIQTRIDEAQPPFDLIFMDIQMPVMSGPDTTRAIRTLESLVEGLRMPIIALTAHALTEEKQILLKSGMDDYVTKPIQIEQLIQILSTWTKVSSNVPLQREEPPVTRQIATVNHDILDWNSSLKLAANKEDLAQDLLSMLINSFDKELDEMQQLIELEDYPQLEQVLHRIYGATRYVGVPQLQRICGDLEQFVAQLRKEKRPADAAFITEFEQRFAQLQHAMQAVKEMAQLILPQTVK